MLLYKGSIKSIRLTEARVAAFTAAGLFVLTVTAALISAVILELFTVRRTDGGSLTTHFPGYVYANATVSKVVIFESVALLVSAIVLRFARRNREPVPAPRYGLTSILSQPAGLLMSSVIVVAVQLFGSHVSVADSSAISRIGVFALLATIAAAAISGVVGLFKKERPLAIASVALLSNVILLLLFYYFHFYKLGFDQDTWAN